jgi:hypothetical protein
MGCIYLGQGALGQSALAETESLSYHTDSNRIGEEGCRHLSKMQMGGLVIIELGSFGLS